MVAASDIDGNDLEPAVHDRAAQSGQGRQLPYARRTPCRPQIEQDVTALELGERNAIAPGIVEGDLRRGNRAFTRGKRGQRHRRHDASLDSAGRHHI